MYVMLEYVNETFLLLAPCCRNRTIGTAKFETKECVFWLPYYT